MLTLTNSFHNTEARTRLTRAEMDELDRLVMCGTTEEARYARRVIRRIWKQLCGIKECQCGNSWGER